MIFGSLNEVLEGDKNIYDVVTENQQSVYKKPNKISSILKTLSRYGMSYEDQVYKNIKAIPADKNLQNKDEMMTQSLYGGVQTNYLIKKEEDKPFAEKTLVQKREILRKMAQEGEIEDIIDIMCNESIVYDSDEAYICKPFLDNAIIQDLNEQSLDEFRTATDTVFYQVYLLMGFKQNAWNLYRRYLIDGTLAFEIIFDDLENPHTIIGFAEVDPATLTKEIKNGVTSWVQYKGVIGRERRLLDSQIIYIKYEDSGVVDRQSYLERLIRPFNLYRIVEQAQIIWTVTQSSFKTMFTIPVAGMNRAKGLQTLNAAMNRYKEDISFNNDTGELKVNGKVNLPFNKEFWMPENENGKPEIETLVDNGPQLNDSEQLKFFASKLYKMSKIPESRFDRDAQSTWFGTDATAALRDEINFGRFVARIRNVFAEIILKPMRIQLALQVPDIKNDKRILDSVSLRWNSYNQFQELMEEEIDQKRMEFIQTLKDTFTDTDEEGNEVNYWSTKYLLVKYLKISDADLELNAKFKFEEEQAKKKKETEDNDDNADNEDENNDLIGDSSFESDMDQQYNDMEETPEENPEPEDNNDSVDSELMGDVQPESPETTTV
jgi:hypothetical protein